MLIINEIPHLNRLDQSISVQRVVTIYSHFTFIFRLNVLNSEDGKETPPHSVEPHLGLLCSHLFHKKDVGLWVELTDIFLYYKEVFKQ